MSTALPEGLDEATARYLRAREAVLDEVRRLLIVSVQLPCATDEIDPDTALFGTGLGLDSLDAVEIVIGLETDLGVKLEGEGARLRALRSVNALVDAVMQHRSLIP
jgi:acyl carrier protein